jgi:hypothetical protein
MKGKEEENGVKEGMVSGEGMTEAPKTRRLREQIKARYADSNPETEEQWTELEDRYADEVEGELGKYKESETTMQEVVQANPELGQLLFDVVINKLPLRVAIAKSIASEDLVPREGDDDYEAYQKAYNERLEGAKKMSALEKQIEANQEASIARIDKFAEEKGLSEEQKNTLLDNIDREFIKILNKEVSPELLEAFYRNLVFDEEMKAAEEAGKIKARNEAIDQKKTKENAENLGDGIPRSEGKGVNTEKSTKKQNEFFSGIKTRKGI